MKNPRTLANKLVNNQSMKFMIRSTIYPKEYDFKKNADFNYGTNKAMETGKSPTKAKFCFLVDNITENKTESITGNFSLIAPYVMYEGMGITIKKKGNQYQEKNLQSVRIYDVVKLDIILQTPEYKNYLKKEIFMDTKKILDHPDVKKVHMDLLALFPNCTYSRMSVVTTVYNLTNKFILLDPLFDTSKEEEIIQTAREKPFLLFFPKRCDELGVMYSEEVLLVDGLQKFCQSRNDFRYFYAWVLIHIMKKKNNRIFCPYNSLLNDWSAEVMTMCTILKQPSPSIELFDEVLRLGEEMEEIKVIVKSPRTPTTRIEADIYLKNVFSDQTMIAMRMAEHQRCNFRFPVSDEKFKAISAKYSLSSKVSIQATDGKDEFGRDITYTQEDALRIVLDNPISLIDGLPGTGKTMILMAVKDVLSETKTACCCFVGRMAETLREKVKEKCADKDVSMVMTIHKAFTLVRTGQGERFKDVEVVAVDEVEYTNVFVLSMIFKAFKNIKKLILIGDANQIRGNSVLIEDLIKTTESLGTHIVLTQNFRSRNTPSIIRNILTLIDKDDRQDLKRNLKYVAFENEIVDCPKDDLLVALTMTRNPENAKKRKTGSSSSTKSVRASKNPKTEWDVLKDGVIQVTHDFAKYGIAENLQFLTYKNETIRNLGAVLENHETNLFISKSSFDKINGSISKSWKSIIRLHDVKQFTGQIYRIDSFYIFRAGSKIMCRVNHNEAILDGVISDSFMNGEDGIIMGIYSVQPNQFREFKVIVFTNGKQIIVHQRVIPATHLKFGGIRTNDMAMGSEYDGVCLIITKDIINGKTLGGGWDLISRAIVAMSRGRKKVYLLGMKSKAKDFTVPERGRGRGQMSVPILGKRTKSSYFDVIDQLQLVMNQETRITASYFYEMFVSFLNGQ